MIIMIRTKEIILFHLLMFFIVQKTNVYFNIHAQIAKPKHMFIGMQKFN